MARHDGGGEPSTMPRYRRYFRDGQTVFLTIATADRRPWLSQGNARPSLLEALRQTRLHHPFNHHGHVLLDDHLHLLLTPHSGAETPTLVGSFKRAAIARLPAGLLSPGQRAWQRRYHDHVIRDAEDFARHLDYLHFNPVKHGLATNAGEWLWSSFQGWRARGAYPPDWGTIEPDHIRTITEAHP